MNFFICGTPRSGTTMLSSILTKHSDIHCFGELHFFDDISESDCAGPISQEVFDRLLSIFERFSQFEDQKLVNQKRDILEEQILGKSFTRYDLYQKFTCLVAPNKLKLVGNSVPRDIFNLEEIANYDEEARFLICLRNPFDFIASYKNRHRTTYDSNVERIRGIYNPITTSLLSRFTHKKALHLKSKFPERIRIVNYEEIVTAPVKEVSKICQFLGVNFENATLEIESHNSSHTDNKVTKKGVFSSSVGKGVNKLTRRENAVVRILCSEQLGTRSGGLQTKTFLDYLYLLTSVPSFLIHVVRSRNLSKQNGRNKSFFSYIRERIR